MVWFAARSRALRKCPRNFTGLAVTSCTSGFAARALRSSKTASPATPSPSKPCEPKPHPAPAEPPMLSKLLRDALSTGASRLKPPSPELLQEVWPSLLGEPLCHRTQPKYWQAKTLVIAVASEAWLKEIKRHQRPVHARIHRLLPWPVDSLEFVVETLPAPPRANSANDSEASAPLIPPAPESLDLPTQDNLARLDDTTRDIMLRIRVHVDAEKGPSTP